MGQKFLFVLVGCIFAAIIGAAFVNNNYVDWPIYESPTIPNIEVIDNNFQPTPGYIEARSLNPSLDKSFIE